METQEKRGSPGFAVPTEESLAGLGPGCFVQVRSEAGCCWVELERVEGEACHGRVHAELASPDCRIAQPPRFAHFRKRDIVALGCDRYCYC